MNYVVTIGMCLHNSESTMRSAIESILKQDFNHKKMQIIFVDDGSQDKTLQIIDEYVSRIDIDSKVFSTQWCGLGKARNLIVDSADSHYILWLDSDEILTASYVKEQGTGAYTIAYRPAL